MSILHFTSKLSHSVSLETPIFDFDDTFVKGCRRTLCYVVSLKAPLTPAKMFVLEGLLKAEHSLGEKSCSNAFWVVPRMGTQSSWSSKTMDLLTCCELPEVEAIEELVCIDYPHGMQVDDLKLLKSSVHDRMTQQIVDTIQDAEHLFNQSKPKTYHVIDLNGGGEGALEHANQEWGLALSAEDILYLESSFKSLNKNPTDVELMMFSQVNSEHCRHKIFNAHWTVDGALESESLFSKIKYTFYCSPANIWVAYHDNAAVVALGEVDYQFHDSLSYQVKMTRQQVGMVIKVETHNHPTAIAPFEGAATGSGGELRDEGATGLGAKPKAGLVGFSVSHLKIPTFQQDYEHDAFTCPIHQASAFEIMLKAPLGAARYNNEFGRPNIVGYFRSFEHHDQKNNKHYGYHKPIMIAGGMGLILKQNVEKKKLPNGSLILVVGGPAMSVGLGGGAASSLSSGQSSSELDFASVQRANPQMQRRVQELINTLSARQEGNPILSIHDVGAGGLCNAIPELVDGSGMGAFIELRAIPNAEPGMSPLAIWCCEAQERYVLALLPEHLDAFQAIAQRESCPFAVIGTVTEQKSLKVYDAAFDNYPVDVPLSLLLGHTPPLHKVAKHNKIERLAEAEYGPLAQALESVLAHPTVASKQFLVTIADRSVGGLVSRDQCVGPWQVPVADCGITTIGFRTFAGEAMAMGERAPLGLLCAKSSAKMAVAESILNLLGADLHQLSDIKLSCNWMAACGDVVHDTALYDAVEAVAKDLCPKLGIAIPVGKDSLSMRTRWKEGDNQFMVESPLSLVVSAFAPVGDVRLTLTPEISDEADSLWLFDLAHRKLPLGGSVYQCTTHQFAGDVPEVDPDLILNVFEALKVLKEKKLIHAYHDRSDGGLWATCLEMAFASRKGLIIQLDSLVPESQFALPALLSEALGFVVACSLSDFEKIQSILQSYQLESFFHCVAKVHSEPDIRVCFKNAELYRNSLVSLHQIWSKVSFYMQASRDNPTCAKAEFDSIRDTHSALKVHVPFQFNKPHLGLKPKVAILREQGINGQHEMAEAFVQAGFEAYDVMMSDLVQGRQRLSDFQVLAACGGFSYGDVLGAGVGWANTILRNHKLKDMFQLFFEKTDTLTLGVCNGCQMLSHLKDIIPGAAAWPLLKENTSKQFEARLSLVKIFASPSLWFQGMDKAILPIVVSHGEGRMHFEAGFELQQDMISMRYVDPNTLMPTERYPYNPNGSSDGATAVSSLDGRATIIMPHPERSVRSCQLSWHPKQWEEISPWQQLFYNAARCFS